MCVVRDGTVLARVLGENARERSDSRWRGGSKWSADVDDSVELLRRNTRTWDGGEPHQACEDERTTARADESIHRDLLSLKLG